MAQLRLLAGFALILRTCRNQVKAWGTPKVPIIMAQYPTIRKYPRLSNVPLLRALWPLLDANSGVLRGSWGVLDMGSV